MDPNSRLPQRDEAIFPAQAEAFGRRAAYPHGVERRADRPLRTALGWRLPNWLLDYGPVALVFVAGAAALATNHAAHVPTRAALFVGLIFITATLAARHRAPVLVLCVVLLLAVVLGWGPVVVLPVLLAVFTVAEYAGRRALIVGTVAAAGVLIAAEALHHVMLTGSSVLVRIVVVGLAVAVGLYLRTRADYINGLRERAERLERERELLAQQSVADERVRIARELHDVVAHNVSLMVVQAQALAATNDAPEDQVALRRVADLGRDALSEMHRMLGLLRLQEGGAPERAPQPGVRDLAKLIEGARETGLDTNLVLEGDPRELPAAIDLSAYRIVQEALTNVIRHAGAAQAIVTLAYTPDALEVTVLDDGAGAAQNGTSDTGSPDGTPTDGHGLVGMRERVQLFGGNLETGRRRYGAGYRVHALLPTR
jgi:signal transduction histidine kinase